MPTSIADLVNTFVNFGQYKLAKQQLADQEKKSQLDAVNLFIKMARDNSDPTQLGGLIQGFTNAGYGNPDQWTQILSQLTPTTEALQAGQTKAGIDVAAGKSTGKGQAADNLARQTANQTLTARDAGQLATGDFIAAALGKAGPPSADLAAATASRVGAGMTPAQLIFDHLKAMMPQAQQQQMVNIEGGLAPNAAQNQANTTALRGQNLQHDEALQRLNYEYKSLNETAIHNRATEGVAFKGLDLEAIRNDNQLAAEMARVKAGGVDLSHLAQLAEVKARVLANIQNKNAVHTPQELISNIGLLNFINDQLERAGMPNEGQMPYNPDMLVDPGAITRFFGQAPIININPRLAAPRQTPPSPPTQNFPNYPNLRQP